MGSDRVSQRRIVETCCFLCLYQIVLLQVLVLLQVALDLQHCLALDQVHVDLLSFRWEKAGKILRVRKRI